MLFAQPIGNRAGITAEVTGTYTLALEGGIGNVGPATYSVRLVPGTTAVVPLSLGATTAGDIALPSQSVAYTFTLPSQTSVLFDSLAADPGLTWSLSGPNGPVVTGESLLQSPLLALAAGAYTLTVSGVGAATGSYSFRLLNAAAATSFGLGATVTATLDVPSGTVLYSFSAAAGDVVSFAVLSGANSAAWELFDPYGRPVFGAANVSSETNVALGATGTYLLAIEGAIGAISAATVPVRVEPRQSDPARDANWHPDHDRHAGHRKLRRDQRAEQLRLHGDGRDAVVFRQFKHRGFVQHYRSARR